MHITRVKSIAHYFLINSLALRLIEHNDLIVLVKAAVGVVLRKDMSLNRRLYAWLLGTQEGKKKVFDGPAKSALIVGLQVNVTLRRYHISVL
jgi:hypothetical protein